MNDEPKTHTKLAAQLLRFSSFHSFSLFVAQAIALTSTFVLVGFLDPSEYGRLALLLLYAALVSLAISLLTKPGTMRRVFGSAGDDDDDDDEDSAEGVQSANPERSLGSGLVLTALAGVGAIGATLLFSGAISDAVLRDDSAPGLMAWAACVGAFMSIHTLASGVVWVERRPSAFAVLAVTLPALTGAGSIGLVATGGGVEGAIAGIAAGSAVASLMAIFFVRRSFSVAFSAGEALAIVRRGAPRVPVVFSFWLVGYAGVFLTSRYLSEADVGVFYLASRLAGITVFVAASYRMALRPLLRSLAFAEAEADHGSAHARGTQLRYFVLLATGVLLAVSMFADAIVGIAPASYADAATLVPLLAAGLLVPRLLQVLNKCVKFRGKRVLFPAAVVVGATSFIIGALVLVPEIGAEGVPAAMAAAFAGPVLFLGVASQRSETPIAMPYAGAALAVSAAAACFAVYELVGPDSLGWQLGLAVGLMAAWSGTVVAVGAIPRSHLKLIRPTIVGAARPGQGRLDPRLAVAALSDGQRAALRDVVTSPEPPPSGSDLTQQGERALRLLLRSARAAGGLGQGSRPAGAQLVRYLFARESVAAHDAVGRELLRSGEIEARELSQLEELVVDLRDSPDEVWNLK
jgi:O-antigen/teichoic acid export membrane protein